DRCEDVAEVSARNVIVRTGEVRVVKEIEELEAKPQFTLFPARNLRVLHHGEIRVEVVRGAEGIPEPRREARLAQGRDKLRRHEARMCVRAGSAFTATAD